MKIKECIDIVDNLKPNQYSIEDKVIWLSFLDQTIINDVLLTHEGYHGEYDDFTGYSADKLSEELIVKSPYDRLYIAYLNMKIDETNGETARYNNSATMFNSYLMEYKKFYNKTHMPISVTERRVFPICPGESEEEEIEFPPYCPDLPPSNEFYIDDAMYEKLARETYEKLEKYTSDMLSDNRIYDIIMNYVYTHTSEFKGRDGRDGRDGKDGYTPQKNVDYFDGKDYVLTESDKKQISEMVDVEAGSVARIGEVTLFASRWAGSGNLYSQIVNIENVTEYTQVDLTPSVEQLAAFYEKDITFVTENDNGVVTVYIIGQKPQNDYTIQTTLTEVEHE